MKNEEKQIQVASGILLLNEDDVVRAIGKDTINEIKERDSDPLFIEMTVGYEGESHGAIFEEMSAGKKIREWMRQVWPIKAIKQLVSKLKGNVPIYETHDVSNSDRYPVGYLLNSTKKVIDGVTHAVGYAYIFNNSVRKKIQNGEIDACSVEARCLFDKMEDIGRYIVDTVKDVIGIALCNSDKEPPGFDKANITAVVMAMAEHDDDKGKGRTMDTTQVTLTDVKKYIESHGVKPDDLFSVKELTAVPKVADAFDADAKAKVEEVQKKNNELNEKLKPFLAQEGMKALADMISKSELLKDEPKRLVDYLQKTIKISLPDGDKKQDIVDNEIKIQMEVLKSAGIKFADDKATDVSKGGGNTGGRAVGNDEKMAFLGDNKYNTPDTNELIPSAGK